MFAEGVRRRLGDWEEIAKRVTDLLEKGLFVLIAGKGIYDACTQPFSVYSDPTLLLTLIASLGTVPAIINDKLSPTMTIREKTIICFTGAGALLGANTCSITGSRFLAQFFPFPSKNIVRLAGSLLGTMYGAISGGLYGKQTGCFLVKYRILPL